MNKKGFKHRNRGVVHSQIRCTDFKSSKKFLDFFGIFGIFRFFRNFSIFFSFLDFSDIFVIFFFFGGGCTRIFLSEPLEYVHPKSKIDRPISNSIKCYLRGSAAGIFIRRGPGHFRSARKWKLIYAADCRLVLMIQ